jgi:hypothetical protein
MSQVNGGATATPAAAPPGDGKRPVGVVVASIVDGVRTLFRQQVELARLEAGEAVAVRGKGAGLMGTAAVIGFLAVGFVAAAASAALDLVLPTWAALLIVAGILGVIGWVLVVAGRRAIRTAPTPELTQETLKEDARWAKRQLAR